MTSLSALSSANVLSNQQVGQKAVVSNAIKVASHSSGVDFSYLMNNAMQESSLNTNAKATTSSATGLFQFVEQTWLQMIKTFGGKYGLDKVAENITIGSDGVARVKDTSTRQAILDLRKDPQVSSVMAAELTSKNKEALESKVKGKIGATELYLAHFLGSSGAATFINKMRQDPNALGADYLPTAAAANSKVFYDKSGQPKTLSQIYNTFAKKFETKDVIKTDQSIQVAGVATVPSFSGLELLGKAAVSDTASLSTTEMSSYTPSVMGRVKAEGSNSYFTAMLLAQMNLGDIGSATSMTSSSERTDETNQKKLFGLNSVV